MIHTRAAASLFFYPLACSQNYQDPGFLTIHIIYNHGTIFHWYVRGLCKCQRKP